MLHKPEYILKVVPAVRAKIDLPQAYFECFRDHPTTRGKRDPVTRLTGIVYVTVPLLMECLRRGAVRLMD